MRLTRKRFPGLLLAGLLCLATAAPVMAQDHPMGPPAGPPMEHSFHEAHGRWWDNPKLASDVGLTDAQRKQMDDVFAKYRPQLESLRSSLHNDEKALHPLLDANHVDQGAVLQQVDIIADARANLEKANARMLLGIRNVFTPEQWQKLRAVAQKHHHDWEQHPCGEWHGPRHRSSPSAGGDVKPAPPPGQ